MWSSWSEFWSMGGYGLYVWGSYGVTVGLMAFELAALKRRRNAALRSVRTLRGTSDGSAR